MVPMQPGRALTSGLGVPLLPLAHWAAGSPQCVRPWRCRPLHPVPLLPSVRVCAVSPPTWRLLTRARALCVSCTMSAATLLLFTGARAVYGMRVLVVIWPHLPPPPFFLRVLYLFFLKNGKGGACTLQAQA